MMPLRNASDSSNEQTGSTYGRYEGEQQYAPQHEEMPYAHFLRDDPGEKVSRPVKDTTNLFRLLIFVIAMVTLLIFVVVCLLVVGGTGGWISFCAASDAILTIASTFITEKGAGKK
jgi:hypothetical protein